MNTWIEAACEKLVSNDLYSITHDLRDPINPAESNSMGTEGSNYRCTDNPQPGFSQFPSA